MYRRASLNRVALLLALASIAALAFSGCGGGGGGNGGGNGGGGGGNIGGKLATITGKVTDTAGNAASGVTVAVVGTALSASTGTAGTYSISSVPLTATQISVTSPDPVNRYYNYGTYNGQYYQFGTTSGSCYITLPALTAGATTTLTAIAMDPAGTNSPPPTPLLNGCPK